MVLAVAHPNPCLVVCLFISPFAVPRRFSLQPSCHLAVVPLSSFSLLFSLLLIHLFQNSRENSFVRGLRRDSVPSWQALPSTAAWEAQGSCLGSSAAWEAQLPG